MPSSFRFEVKTPLWVRLQGRSIHREDFFSWAWREFAALGLQGIHEGTILSEAAAEQGLATESWTVDSAQAPRERDWVAGMSDAHAEFYFENPEGAKKARELIAREAGLSPGEVQEVLDEDWDAQWKASFLGSPDGVAIPPNWRVIPPWRESALPGEVALKINPGAGFGTGTHETTQLCLTAVAEAWQGLPTGTRALDFGSGSGILAVGLALLGARVDAVEIDPLAVDNARENENLNASQVRGPGIQWALQLADLKDSPDGGYDLVVANILRPVLIQFAQELVERLAPWGTLVLSGLVEADVPLVIEAFSRAFLAQKKHEPKPVVRILGDWRAIVWRSSKQSLISDQAVAERVKENFSEALMLTAREKSWKALHAIRSRLRTGMSETDALTVAREVCAELGSTRAWHMPKIRFDQNTLLNFSEPSTPGVLLKPDSIFFVDLGPVFEGYEGDVGETFTMPEASAEKIRCARDCKQLFGRVQSHWRSGHVSGRELYQFAENAARDLGWILNTEIVGHRAGDFPHALYSKAQLGQAGFVPAPYVWVLEIQLRHPTEAWGAFYEDILTKS